MANDDLRPIGDVIGPGLRLLLVGINPGRRASEVGHHFARPGNRFWPALFAAGVTPRLLGPAEQELLVDYGMGITNLCPRPSDRAEELTRAELQAGATRLVGVVERHRPAVVAVLGVSAYRVAFGEPRAQVGPLPAHGGGARWWVLHNPSGLNAHALPADHARSLRQAADAAGLPDYRPR